jgi:hypothetical protein
MPLVHFPPQVNTEFAVSYKEQSSFGQIIVVDSENYRNTLGGQNTAFINVRKVGAESYQWDMNDSDQRRAQRCAVTYLSVLLPTHSTGVHAYFTDTVNKNTVLHYTACRSSGSQKSGNTNERLLKLPQKLGTR